MSEEIKEAYKGIKNKHLSDIEVAIDLLKQSLESLKENVKEIKQVKLTDDGVSEGPSIDPLTC